jgi:viologen exporter family transport system permease protein
VKSKLNLFLKLIGVCLRSQMQHRASFLMLTAAHFLATFVEIAAIWVLFDRFKTLQGWSLEQLALIYGIIHMGFAAAEGLARGFDTFDRMLKLGDFDRILLRPMGTFFQIAAREIQLMRLGRFFQGLVVLLWGCRKLQLTMDSYEMPVIVFAVIGTTCLFYGLFVIQAAFCFWTTETLELMNITTYGGVESGQYPMSIYKKGFRWFFTFIVPLGCVAYYPIASSLKIENIPTGLGVLLPSFGILFLLAASKLWHVGVKRYHSTGS